MALQQVSRPDICLPEVNGALEEHPCNLLEILGIIRYEEQVFARCAPVDQVILLKDFPEPGCNYSGGVNHLNGEVEELADLVTDYGLVRASEYQPVNVLQLAVREVGSYYCVADVIKDEALLYHRDK